MQDTPIRKLHIFPSLFLYQEAQISKLDPYFGLVLSIVVNTGYDYELYMHDGIFVTYSSINILKVNGFKTKA